VKGPAWRVGLFAIVGLALLALALVLAGGHWFVPRETGLMRFGGSVYGLQIGSPVLFRGVRVGQVSGIELVPGNEPGRPVLIEVTAHFERALLRQMLGGAPNRPDAAGEAAAGRIVHTLVARGLVARLATQSLLTGQLYVNLDVEPARALASSAGGSATGAAASSASSAAGPAVIPTAATALQSLQAQLEAFDFGQIGRDLSALTASLRQLMGSPEPARLLTRAADAAQSLEQLAKRLEREVAPLSRSAQGAATRVGQGAEQLGQSAQQVAQQVAGVASAAQAQVGALGGAGTAALTQVQKSAEAMEQAALALRGAVGDDSTLRVQSERAMRDVSQAARALRELAELLERHPEALLRGRAAGATAGSTP
jgi:paraquat-inducible protein B